MISKSLLENSGEITGKIARIKWSDRKISIFGLIRLEVLSQIYHHHQHFLSAQEFESLLLFAWITLSGSQIHGLPYLRPGKTIHNMVSDVSKTKATFLCLECPHSSLSHLKQDPNLVLYPNPKILSCNLYLQPYMSRPFLTLQPHHPLLLLKHSGKALC